MPEGPECKRYVDAINETFQNRIITNVEILSGRYVKHGLPHGFEKFEQELPLQIKQVHVKGKFIYFELDNSTYIWNTLGMSGSWTTSLDSDTRLKFSGPYFPKPLYFSDRRNFGTFKFGMTKAETDKKLDSLGYDFLKYSELPPLQLSIDLFKLKRNQNNTLAQILMNQKNYAGVGNYIKAEALYRAKLSPHRKGSSLSADDIKSLHEAVYNVITASYAKHSNLLVNYYDLPTFEKVVYKKAYDPLGNVVKAEETLDKRTTHWVPSIQK